MHVIDTSITSSSNKLAPFFFPYPRPPRYLHSFPTRRSSDLVANIPGRPRRGENDIRITWRQLQRPPHRCFRTWPIRSEEHTSELQSQFHLVCRLLLEKKKIERKTPRVVGIGCS